METENQHLNPDTKTEAKPSLHRNLVKALGAALNRIFVEHKSAEQVIDRLLQEDSRYGARDRRFLAETAYDLVRYWRWTEAWEPLLPSGLDPVYAKVCYWLIYQGYPHPTWEEAVNWPQQQELTTQLATVCTENACVKVSFPNWLVEKFKDELPERWEKELAGLNAEAPVYIRANRLKNTPEELQAVLKMEGVEAQLVSEAPDALMLPKRTNVLRLGSFRKGLYEMQDASSQLIAPFLQVEPNHSVIDACAGAGGKSLHLAALMQNQGKIISMDVEGWKLEELKKRASRNGVKIINTRVIDKAKVIRELEKKADRLLLDVPCSGLGVVRRQPGTKWRLNNEALENVKDTQWEIISTYSKMLKVGGLMVYATCSLLPSEDEIQVNTFLENNKDFKFIKDHRSWPSEGWDGFYMALLQRVK